MSEVKNHLEQLRKPPDPEASYYPDEELRTCTQNIHEELTLLNQLFSQREPKNALEQSLFALEDMQQAIDDIFEILHNFGGGVWQFIRHSRKINSQTSRAYGKVETNAQIFFQKMHIAIDELTAYILNTMPIPLSEYTKDHIHYNQARENPQGTIQLAFSLFEHRLRAKLDVGSDIFGEDLINTAFGKNGRIAYGNTPAERVGMRNLVSGFYATFRNPRMHRILSDDEGTALTVVAFIDLLARIVERAEEEA